MELRLKFGKIESKIISLLKKLLKLLGVGITSYENLVNLRQNNHNLSRFQLDLEFIKGVSISNYKLTLDLLSKSKSQLRQDVFVLTETNYKREGFFVEFGATNGIYLSNTYLLETEYAWKGILAEPAKVWSGNIRENRPNSSIETLCVWKDSISTLVFNETELAELSTVDTFSENDMHKDSRLNGKKYEVKTISLVDLLKKHNAPKNIDYLSIDTEGSEYEILSSFDFNEYNIQIITVEHNNTSQRALIFSLLSSHGYTRKYERISDFDDWYTKN